MDTPSELNEVVLPQNVIGPLTRSAIFLVLCIRQEEDAYARLRAFCAGLSGLVRAVELRDVSIGYLSHNDSAVQLYLQRHSSSACSPPKQELRYRRHKNLPDGRTNAKRPVNRMKDGKPVDEDVPGACFLLKAWMPLSC